MTLREPHPDARRYRVEFSRVGEEELAGASFFFEASTEDKLAERIHGFVSARIGDLGVFTVEVTMTGHGVGRGWIAGGRLGAFIVEDEGPITR